MRKNTDQIESLLAGYVEGDLDSRQRAAVERYLSANPSQQRMVRQMIEARGLLRSLPREPAPSDLREDVQAQLERGLLLGEPIDDEVEAAEMRINRWSQLRAAAAIAVLVAGVAAAVYWALPEDRRRPDDVAIAPVDVPRIGDAEREGPRRETDALAGGMAFNRVDGPAADPPVPAAAVPAPAAGEEPSTPAPEPSTSAPEPSTPAGDAGGREPNLHSERPGFAASASRDADVFGWLPLRLDDPTSPDASLLEAARNDPLLVPASTLAVSNAADMLVTVRTDDTSSANVAAASYFKANGIAAMPVQVSDELRLNEIAGRSTPGDTGRSPTEDTPTEPALPSPATRPSGAADAADLAESADRKLEEPSLNFHRTLGEDQVLLARGITVQQAAELGKWVAAEAARQGKSARPADIRLYARAPAEVAERFARQSPQQQQLPAAQIDQAGQDNLRQQAQRDEQQANEDDTLRELAAGDVLLVAVPSADGGVRESRVRVADDGSIELPMLGRVPAAGLTPSQLAELIVARLADQPQVAAQKAGVPVSVRRVPAPVVPRLRWQNAPPREGQAGPDRRDLLLIIRAELPPTPATLPSTRPETDR